MDPLTVSTTIARPREEVFAYLLDVANHPEFTDHYLVDWHLTREDSVGRGAGARYKVKRARNRFGYADLTITEVDAPWRIITQGRGGKYNRNRQLGVYELQPDHGGTRVEFTITSEANMPSDKIVEAFGMRGWYKRKSAKALKRLRTILEDGEGRGQRATVAGR